MKLRITHPGYHDQYGEPAPLGTVLTVKGDTIPASLLNKCEVVAGDEAEKTAVTNPGDTAPVKTPRRKGLETQAGKLEVAFTDDMSDEDLQAAIKAAKTGV